MRFRVLVAVGLLVLAGAAPAVGTAASGAQDSCSFPVSMVDAGGTEVTVEEEPERVVTLNPSVAQTMWEIGAKDKVVGVSKHASYLEGASEKTNVSGGEQTIVSETVVDLEPDLVLAPNTIENDTVDQLREAGLTVYHFPEATSIEDVYTKVETVGRLAGECEGAAETVDWMQEEIETVEQAVEGRERPDVLYAFFGYTAGEDTFINEIIETAGGNNIAAEMNISTYRQINEEVVVDEDPDWIVRNSNDPAMPRSEAFNATTAVKEDQIVIVPIEHLNQPAPRIVHAITQLAEAFHPEAYAAADATTSDPGSPTPTDSSGQPGFGGVAAIVAIAMTLFAARTGR